MVIGSVLLQPQRLERASQRTNDEAVLDDLIALATCLATDGLEGGSLVETMGASAYGTVTRLAERSGAGANRAALRLAGLFQPAIDRMTALVDQAPDDAGSVIDDAEDLFIGLTNTLKSLSPAQIRERIDEVFDILETDLHITPTFVQEMVNGLFDDMVLALQQPAPDETDAQRANRRSAAGALSRIRRAMQQLFIFPALNADDAAQALITLLQRPDVSGALTQAACAGEAAAAYSRAGNAITDLLPYSGFPSFGNGGMGAAATAPDREEICFFASKLLEYDNIDGDLGKLPLPAEAEIENGRVSDTLRDAFLHCSVVLSRQAFVVTKKQNKKWTVYDRKTFIIRWITGTRFVVYRLFEIGENDFLKAIAGDQSGLRKVFRDNGIILLESDSISVAHEVGSNLWTIDIGSGTTYNALRAGGKLTITPASTTQGLFEANGDFMADLDAKKLPPALRQAYETHGIPLTAWAKVSVRESGMQWLLDDGDYEYTIERDEGKFAVETGGFWGWVRSKINKPKGDLVWINRERTQVLLGQRIMHIGTDVSWEDAPIFKRLPNSNNRHFSLKNAAETIEKWAYHTSWIQDGTGSVIGNIKIGISIGEDDFAYSLAGDIYESGRALSEMIIKLAQQRPMSVVVGWGFWYDLMLDAIGYLIKGIQALVKALEEEEAPPTGPEASASEFSKKLDSILGVVGVEVADTHWTDLIIEFILSLLTLINHIEPTDASQERPENYKESGGFIDPFWKISLLIYAAAVPDSEYALPFQTTSLTAGYWLGGATGIGLVAGFLGILAGQGGVAKTNVFADGGHLAKTLLKSTGKSLLYFWPYLKLVKGQNE